MEKNNKIIHYIWFGGNPISELTKKCIATWKKYLPDFEIKEWNENNFDVTQCPFVKEAFEQKKWAFVADYTRFKVLEEYGGIYLDTDMEITADISKFLEDDLFLGVEDSKQINAAVVWAKEAHNPYIKDIVDIYESKKKFNETGDLYDESVPKVLTKYFSKFGFDGEKDEIQIFENNKIHIYPMEYFYPLSYDYQNNKFTDNSVMIHHFDATWIKPMEKFKTKMKRKNMVWVVYIIDFFINTKNKLKFFCNSRDISIFSIMFCILMLALCAFMPINNESYIFSEINKTSIIQILAFSLIWTFITAKIRSIDLNFFSDKMTNTKSNSEEYRHVRLDLEQTFKLQARERRIFIVEVLVTIFVALWAPLQSLIVLPNNYILYSLLIMLNLYFIYLGIKKEYTFRILELIPLAIINVLLIFTMPEVGIISSLTSFGYIFSNLIIKKIKPKRIKSYAITYCVSLVIFLIISLAIPKFNNFKSVKFGSVITSDITQEYDSYIEESDAMTQFNAGTMFKNNLQFSVENKNIFYNSLVYIVISVIISVIMSILLKKKEYLILGVLALINGIFLMSVNIQSITLTSCIICLCMLLFMLENLMNVICDTIWKE